MKRMTWLAGACLLGGLLVVAVMSGLRRPPLPARAAHVAAPSANPLDVVINEAAWAGHAIHVADEWIELYNNGTQTTSLNGWQLYSSDGGPSITLSGDIPPQGYYLIERTDDGTVMYVQADLTPSFGNGLLNTGEVLTLTDHMGNVIDTANAENGGAWPAGAASTGLITYATMERIDPTAPDTDANWCTNDGITRNGQDADENPINGTPKEPNSCYQPPAGHDADLVVGKTGPDTVDAGDLITYHITLSNSGIVTAASTLLTDTLPAAVDFVAQTSDFPFSRCGQNLYWQAGDVPTDTQHLITITARVTDAGSITLTNRVTATTTSSETVIANNVATCQTTVGAAEEPEAEPQVLISAVLYDGYQSGDPDEAVQLANTGTAPADLKDWRLCDEGTGGACAILPSTILSAGQRIWLANWASDFYTSFGFLPDLAVHPVATVGSLSGSWPGYANTGDEVVLRNDLGNVADALVYEDGSTSVVGWSGPAVQHYGVGREEGQVLCRTADESTGFPVADTDTRADWIQYTDDTARGRRVLYPGWDLDPLFWPLTATEPATVVAGIAPDNAFDVVSQTIARAQRTISVEVYSLRHPDVITALVQKAQEGVAVTVLLEGGQAGVGTGDPRWQQELWACQQLEAAGGQCWFMIHETDDRIFNRYDYLHAKFLIVDDEWVLVTSQNLSASSMPSDDKSNGTYGSRGVVLATNGPSVVARAAQVFALDLDPAHHNDILRWNTRYTAGYGPPDPAYTPVLTVPDHVTYTVRFPAPLTVNGTFGFELFTAPEAALRQSDALLGLLARAGAGDTVYIEQLYEYVAWGEDPADDPNLRLEATIAAARQGATVRLLLNGGTLGQIFYQNTNTSTVAYVNQVAYAEGLDLEAVIGDPTQWGIHNKMVLVWLHDEGGYTHVGSINGSESSNKVNREMALQVKSDEVYHYLARLFEADWALAHPVFLPLLMRGHTPPPSPADYVVISEVYYAGSAGAEWVELYNPTAQTVDLTNYKIGDAETAGRFEGMYQFPPGTTISPQTVLVVACDGSQVVQADFEMSDNSDTPDMVRYAGWGTGEWVLRNDGDQVLLLGPADQVVDAVVWGDVTYPGVNPHAGVSVFTHSLEREPPYCDTDDCASDFRDRYPPTPGGVHGFSRRRRLIGRMQTLES